MRTVNILGTIYTIRHKSQKNDNRLNDCDGYIDWTTHQIVVEKEIDGNLEDMKAYTAKVTRHEIVHAFLFESGMAESSSPCDRWAQNEEMVDWIARQGKKIYKAWEQADVL